MILSYQGSEGGSGGPLIEDTSTAPAPTASFTYSLSDYAVQFTDTSTVDGDTITSWLWDFGDGSFSYAQHPLHVYPDSTPYTATLTVTTSQGRTSTVSQEIIVPELTGLEEAVNASIQAGGYGTRVVRPNAAEVFDAEIRWSGFLSALILAAGRGSTVWRWDGGPVDGYLFNIDQCQDFVIEHATIEPVTQLYAALVIQDTKTNVGTSVNSVNNVRSSRVSLRYMRVTGMVGGVITHGLYSVAVYIKLGADDAAKNDLHEINHFMAQGYLDAGVLIEGQAARNISIVKVELQGRDVSFVGVDTSRIPGKGGSMLVHRSLIVQHWFADLVFGDRSGPQTIVSSWFEQSARFIVAKDHTGIDGSQNEHCPIEVIGTRWGGDYLIIPPDGRVVDIPHSGPFAMRDCQLGIRQPTHLLVFHMEPRDDFRDYGFKCIDTIFQCTNPKGRGIFSGVIPQDVSGSFVTNGSTSEDRYPILPPVDNGVRICHYEKEWIARGFQMAPDHWAVCQENTQPRAWAAATRWHNGAASAAVTAVDSGAANSITVPGHGLVTGQGPLTFTTSGTLPSPLVAGTRYFAIVVDENTLQIASSLANAYTATELDLTTGGSGTHTMAWTGIYQQTTKVCNVDRAYILLTDGRGADATDTVESVDAGTNQLTLTSHNYQTGTGPVTLSTSGTLPAPLSPASNYYLIRDSANLVRVATSLANALAGTAVNITDAGTGTHTINWAGPSTTVASIIDGEAEWMFLHEGNARVFDLRATKRYWDLRCIGDVTQQVIVSNPDTVEAVDTTDNELTLTGHTFLTGNGPVYLTTDDTLPGGLEEDAAYWVIRVDADTIQVAESLEKALAGDEVDITSSGSGTHTVNQGWDHYLIEVAEGAGNQLRYQDDDHELDPNNQSVFAWGILDGGISVSGADRHLYGMGSENNADPGGPNARFTSGGLLRWMVNNQHHTGSFDYRTIREGQAWAIGMMYNRLTQETYAETVYRGDVINGERVEVSWADTGAAIVGSNAGKGWGAQTDSFTSAGFKLRACGMMLGRRAEVLDVTAFLRHLLLTSREGD